MRSATVMRLWPNQIRVNLVERTPVAFALDGNTVRLVDDQGILLDLPDAASQHYSFPVLTGITSADPLPIRAARIAMYLQFIHALDAQGGRISSTLSQVDLSDPEDVRAIFLGAVRSASGALRRFGLSGALPGLPGAFDGMAAAISRIAIGRYALRKTGGARYRFGAGRIVRAAG